jgi:hypothetical protein
MFGDTLNTNCNSRFVYFYVDILLDVLAGEIEAQFLRQEFISAEEIDSLRCESVISFTEAVIELIDKGESATS